MIIINNEKYLTKRESCEFLQISLMTLNRWIKDGKLKTYKMSSRKIFLKEINLICVIQ